MPVRTLIGQRGLPRERLALNMHNGAALLAA
jgi:hypothetical protein